MRILFALLWGTLVVACGGQVGGPSDSGTDSPGDSSGFADVFQTGDSGPMAMACAAKGGSFCTTNHWIICPKGYQPVSSTDPLGCGANGDTGWCCEPAPPSTCSSSGSTNCLDACPTCWKGQSSFACPNGKVCCEYICD